MCTSAQFSPSTYALHSGSQKYFFLSFLKLLPISTFCPQINAAFLLIYETFVSFTLHTLLHSPLKAPVFIQSNNSLNVLAFPGLQHCFNTSIEHFQIFASEMFSLFSLTLPRALGCKRGGGWWSAVTPCPEPL